MCIVKLDFHRHTLTYDTSLHHDASKLRCSLPVEARRGEREGSARLLPEAILSRHDITARPQIRNLIGTNEHFQFTGSSIQIGKTRRKRGNVEITKVSFCRKYLSLYRNRTGIHIYVEILFIRARYIRNDDAAHRLCAFIDNLVLVERRMREGREETRREEKRTIAISFYIYFRAISRAIIFTFFIRETSRCLTDRSARRRNISFTKVCAKRESSCLISSSAGGYFTHSRSFTFHVDLGMAVFAV